VSKIWYTDADPSYLSLQKRRRHCSRLWVQAASWKIVKCQLLLL